MPQLQPINLTEVIVSSLAIMVILIPVAGWTLRFALKPLVEAYGVLRQAAAPSELLTLQRRVLELEVQVRALESRTNLPA